MSEKDQTVVRDAEIATSMRNAALNGSQMRVFERLARPARRFKFRYTRGFHRGVWYTNAECHSGRIRTRTELNRLSRFVIRGSLDFMLQSRLGLLLCLALLSGVLAMACPGSMAHAASGRVTIESGGQARSAILVEHARLKKTRRPVIIILHPGGGAASRTRHMLGLEDKSRSASPVMVYPEALSGHWNDASKPGDNRDVTFIHDLVAKLISEGIADRRRIFIVGISSGGLMAMKLACAGTEDFAGVVAIFATLPADLAASCKPARPLPFLLLIGNGRSLRSL